MTGAGITEAAYLALPDGHDPASWHAGSLTRHVIETHRDRLDPANGIPAQLAALRALAPSLAALSGQHRAAAIAHLRQRTGLLALTIHDTITAASKRPRAAADRARPPLSALPTDGPNR